VKEKSYFFHPTAVFRLYLRDWKRRLCMLRTPVGTGAFQRTTCYSYLGVFSGDSRMGDSELGHSSTLYTRLCQTKRPPPSWRSIRSPDESEQFSQLTFAQKLTYISKTIHSRIQRIYGYGMRPLLIWLFLSKNCEKNIERWPRGAP